MKNVFLTLALFLGTSSAFGQTLHHTETIYTAFRRSECKSITDLPSNCIETELIKTPFLFEFFSHIDQYGHDFVHTNENIINRTLFNKIVLEFNIKLIQYVPTDKEGFGIQFFSRPAETGPSDYGFYCGGVLSCNYGLFIIKGISHYGPLKGNRYHYYTDTKPPFHVHLYEFSFTTNKQLWDQIN